MLSANNISKSFGGTQVINSCSLAIEAGKITGLIGPNGAGKTTLFGILSGFIRPDGGQVVYDGKDITGKPPFELFRLGLCRTFQICREFRDLTVLENLLVVPTNQQGEVFWGPLLTPWKVMRQERAIRRKAMDVLESIKLHEAADKPAWTLSVGQRRLLDLGRALMADARLLLLDEPGAGVSPALTEVIANYIRWMSRDNGVTVLLIEHDIDLVVSICDSITVMAGGKVLKSGLPQEIVKDASVVDAYLGGG